MKIILCSFILTFRILSQAKNGAPRSSSFSLIKDILNYGTNLVKQNEWMAIIKIQFISNIVHNILRKIKRASKVTQNRKTLIYAFRYYFLSASAKKHYRGLGTGLCPMQFSNFPNISLFLKIVSLKSFGNS